MNRRTFVSTTAGIAGLTAFATAPAIAKRSGTGPPSGKGGGRDTVSELVNAERTDEGAIVATGDDFVISGQTIEVDGREFYDGAEGAYVVYNDGYSGAITDNEITVAEMAESPTFGVRVEDADVDVVSNAIDGDDALAEQFLSVSFADGATGSAESNALNGGHRVGVLAAGSGTDVSIRDNEVTGLGPNPTGGPRTESRSRTGQSLTSAATRSRTTGGTTTTSSPPESSSTSRVTASTSSAIRSGTTTPASPSGAGTSTTRFTTPSKSRTTTRERTGPPTTASWP